MHVYISGYNKLLQIQDQDTTKIQYVQKEADWFIKIGNLIPF